MLIKGRQVRIYCHLNWDIPEGLWPSACLRCSSVQPWTPAWPTPTYSSQQHKHFRSTLFLAHVCCNGGQSLLNKNETTVQWFVRNGIFCNSLQSVASRKFWNLCTFLFLCAWRESRMYSGVQITMNVLQSRVVLTQLTSFFIEEAVHHNFLIKIFHSSISRIGTLYNRNNNYNMMHLSAKDGACQLRRRMAAA